MRIALEYYFWMKMDEVIRPFFLTDKYNFLEDNFYAQKYIIFHVTLLRHLSLSGFDLAQKGRGQLATMHAFLRK